MIGETGYTKWPYVLAILIVLLFIIVAVGKAQTSNEIDSVVAEEWEGLMHLSGQQCGVVHNEPLPVFGYIGNQVWSGKRLLQMMCSIRRKMADTTTWHPPMIRRMW